MYLASIHPLEHRSTSPWLQKYLQTRTDVSRGWGRELPLIGEPQAWSHPGLGDSPPLWVSLAPEPEPTDTSPHSGLRIPTHTSCSTDHVHHLVLCLSLARGSQCWVRLAEPVPGHPSRCGPGSCPWEPGAPSKKAVSTRESSGALPGNSPETRKLPGGISSTASWFFEGLCGLGGGQRAWGRG